MTDEDKSRVQIVCALIGRGFPPLHAPLAAEAVLRELEKIHPVEWSQRGPEQDRDAWDAQVKAASVRFFDRLDRMKECLREGDTTSMYLDRVVDRVDAPQSSTAPHVAEPPAFPEL